MVKGNNFETIFFKTMALREWEAGRLREGMRGWEAERPGRLRGWETGRLGNWEAGGLGG